MSCNFLINTFLYNPIENIPQHQDEIKLLNSNNKYMYSCVKYAANVQNESQHYN